jgi:hypothetical protein
MEGGKSRREGKGHKSARFPYSGYFFSFWGVLGLFCPFLRFFFLTPLFYLTCALF